MTLLTSSSVNSQPTQSQQQQQQINPSTNLSTTTSPKYLLNSTQIKYIQPSFVQNYRRPFYSTSKVPSSSNNSVLNPWQFKSPSNQVTNNAFTNLYNSSDGLNHFEKSAFQPPVKQESKHLNNFNHQPSISSSVSSSSTSTCLSSNLNSSSVSSNEMLIHHHGNTCSSQLGGREVRLKSVNDFALPPNGLLGRKVKTSSVSGNSDRHRTDNGRHASTNSAKIQVIVTPRNSSNSAFEEPRRTSYNNPYSNNKGNLYAKRSSNCFEREEPEDEDDIMVDNLDLNYEEDDDIFEEASETRVNMCPTSTAEINVANLTTPNSSASTSSSSISSSSVTIEYEREPNIVTRPSRKSVFGAITQKFKSNNNNKDKSFSLSSSVLTRTSASSPDLIKKKHPRDNNNTSNIPSKLNPTFRNNILKNLTNNLNQQTQPKLVEANLYNSTNECSIMRSLKNFSHFDIQSVFFNFNSLALEFQQSKDTTNIRTGASLALEQINKVNRNSTSVLSFESQPDNDSFSIRTPKEKFDSPTQCKTSLKIFGDEQLVEECPCFRVERGGDSFAGLGLVKESLRQIMELNSTILLSDVSCKYDKQMMALIRENQSSPFKLEYQDWGAFFYRYYFYGQEHSNYLSDDSVVGPVAISIRREKVSRSNSKSFNLTEVNEKCSEYAYRFIMRSSGSSVLRGSVLENHVAAAKSKEISHEDVIHHLLPDLKMDQILTTNPKSEISELLLKLDENYYTTTHKIGVLLCKAGQSTEEEMYNNRESTPEFEEFLRMLGEKVTLKGFTGFKGGLDSTEHATSGTHTVYTKFRDKEIMFHVSTLLPYIDNDRQQIPRKRHIGNDMVTVVFQEAGALPFSPKRMRSNFQHIFIVIRAVRGSGKTQYRVAVSCEQSVPAFGPPLPPNPLFESGREFREFLLAKIVNAENAGFRTRKFAILKSKTLAGSIMEMINKWRSKTLLSTNAGKFGILFNKSKTKKARSKSLSNESKLDEMCAYDLLKLSGTVFWNVELIEDLENSLENCCFLGIGPFNVVVVNARSKSVVFSVPCRAVVGWTVFANEDNFLLYFDQGEFVNVHFRNRYDLNNAIVFLQKMTKGCHTVELSLEKKDYGKLGFSLQQDAVVTEVEPNSVACLRGLVQGSKIVKIDDHFIINLHHDKMIELLRKSACLSVTFLPPLDNGLARRGEDDNYSLYAYLSTCSSLNERLIDSVRTPQQLFIKNRVHQQPLQSVGSPTSHRKRITSSSKPNRLSSVSGTGALINSNTNFPFQAPSGDAEKLGKVFANSLYFGYENLPHSAESKLNKNGHKSVSSNKYQDIFPIKTPEHVLSAKKINPSSNGLNNSNSEWSKLVKTASRVFENTQRESETCYCPDEVACKTTPLSSSNYISTDEILESDPNSLKGSKTFVVSKEKPISFDDFKDTFVQLQSELNQEKLENYKANVKLANVLEENMVLKQELLKIKDELFNNKLRMQSSTGLK